ncbi:MAG: arginine--tRNA ligase [Candidatus Bathyarchaeia archaeon]
MSDPLKELRDECNRLLTDAAGAAFPEMDLPEVRYNQPPDITLGELSSPVCFQLSMFLRKSPKEIAEEIANAVDSSSSDLISSVEAVNGYINFRSEPRVFSELVLESSKDPVYGFLKAEEPDRVMVEHTSANPNGPIHIGNARNSILGDCLAEMLERRGHDIVVHFLVNDMGRQVAMATYGWKLLGKPEPDKPAELWVGTIYASLNVIIQMRDLEEEFEEAEEWGLTSKADKCVRELAEYNLATQDLRERNSCIFDTLKERLSQVEDPESEIVKLNTRYEEGEEEAVEEVRQLVGYCLQGFQDSLGDLGIQFNSFDFESDLVWENRADEVLEELSDTPYVYEDEGALVLECDRIAEDYDLKDRWGLNPEHEIPSLVLVRSDGTTLYTLRDIAYTIWKFSLVDRVINVVGYEQTLAQLQLRIALAAIDRLWMGDKQTHYAYEFVKLPGVKMSGRLGRYVTLLEVLDRAVELAYQEVDERMRHLSEEEKREIARMVGYGAVKYTLLNVDPMKTVVFDWDTALNFETNSAPFIQYSYARACNILKKVKEAPDPDYSQLVDPKERSLVLSLSEWPGVFIGAADELKPGILTVYANNLADRFNSFYASLHVLNADTEGLKGARIELVRGVRSVLSKALGLLGIEAPERM